MRLNDRPDRSGPGVLEKFLKNSYKETFGHMTTITVYKYTEGRVE